MRMPTILDCDPGIDDAVALYLALALDKIDLKLVTTVSGNVSLADVHANARKLLAFYGASCPLAKGAERPLVFDPVYAYHVHGATGLGDYDFPKLEAERNPKKAVAAMVELLEASPVPVAILGIGPLTNLAMLVEQRRDLLPKIEGFYIMGTGISRGNITPYAEFNTYVDPQALKIVLDAKRPCTMLPLECGLWAPLDLEDLDFIEDQGPIGAMTAALFRRYYSSVEQKLHIYDSFAVAALTGESFLHFEQADLDVDLSAGPMRGKTSYKMHAGGAVRVATKVDAKAYRAFICAQYARGLCA